MQVLLLEGSSLGFLEDDDDDEGEVDDESSDFLLDESLKRDREKS